MFRLVAVALLGATIAVPAVAQELLGGYFAYINQEDMYNSKGTRLGNFCAIVQQDRANYHKYRIRHEWDEEDPWFTAFEMRKKISADCRVAPGNEYVSDAVLRGEPKLIRVQVYGRGGVPQFVVVHEGAG